MKAATAIATTDVPPAVLTRTVARYEASADPEAAPVKLPDAEVQATYCWLFSTDPAALEGREFVNADAPPFFNLDLTGEEDEDLGPVVGYVAKLDPRDGAFKWAGPASPREVRRREYESWNRSERSLSHA